MSNNSLTPGTFVINILNEKWGIGQVQSSIKEKVVMKNAGHNLFISSPDQDLIFQKILSFFNQFRDINS